MTMSSPVKPREWEKSLTVKCRLCGGAKCKRCSESAALAKTDSPIVGLHADWVTDRILGMMRPSSRLIKEQNIVQQFHKLRIAAVFNLTLPGEHPYCGDGLVGSGFPYDPEKDFMAEQIHFYNFGWEDMTTPTLSYMLDIAKVMTSVLQDGNNRIAVHCHAGYGRTGLAIACCLIFMHSIPPDRAITIVRRDRPGSIQTSAQAKFVRRFHEYINESKMVFALPFIHDRFSIADVVEQQNRMVHGVDGVGAHVALPRIIDFLCREVEKGAEVSPAPVIHGFIGHVPWRVQDKRGSIPDVSELQSRHMSAVYSNKSPDNQKNASSLPANSTTPPPVPSSLCGIEYYVSQEDLFPVKVEFNVGEWNWSEAMNQCHLASYYPALLLDWLEHLAEPMLSPEVVPTVSAAEGDTKWKGLNQQPSHVVKSLHRLLACLKILIRRAETISVAGGSSLVDALAVRAAMAMFHFTSSTPVASLYKHSEFVLEMCREWQPTKRLELNLETLQKLGGKGSTVRRLSFTKPGHELVPPISPTSPQRTIEPLALEALIHPRVMTTGDLPSPRVKELSSPKPTEASPHRPDQTHTHARHGELPAMHKERELKEGESSPVRTDPLIPRLTIIDNHHPIDREGLMMPTPPDHTHSNALPRAGSPLVSHSPTLPSVRGNDRYKSAKN